MKTIAMPCDSCDAETVVCFTRDDVELVIDAERDWKVFVADDGEGHVSLAFRCPECLKRTGA